MTAEPAESVPAGPAEDSHPYPEHPPALPLRLAGHIGSTVAAGNAAWLAAVRREWANGDPAIPPVIIPPGALPVRRAVQAVPEPEPVPELPPRPRVDPSARLSALPDPAPTPAHEGQRKPLFAWPRRERLPQHAEGDRLDEMAQAKAEPPARDQAAVWPRPEADGPAYPERAAENVPRPGQDVDERALPSITGPGHQDAAPMRSGTAPPPVAEPAPEPAADNDAEQFGAPDEPFWPGSHGVVVPPETTEMTAVIERPSEEQQ